MTARILVVDDEPDLEDLIRQKFRRQIRDGIIEFIFARDGVEALDVLRTNQDVDLVLTDINMPRMDGLTLLQNLQEIEGDFSTVIVSAYGDMDNIRTAMNRGAFDFLVKPIDFIDFETTIDKTIRHVELLREARRREVENQRLQLASEHKSRFLASMSHELRTPLNAILGYTELILDSVYGDMPERARGVLDRIQRNGRHLLSLINDVLDLSKIEAGQSSLLLADYSVRDVVQNVQSAVEPLASEKKIALRTLCSAGITRPQRSYDPVRLPPWPPPIATLRPLPSPLTGLPRLLESPFQRAVPITPADRTGACIDCFPIHSAFPVMQAGRHPRLHFRGLLGLHSRYGPPDRSAAQGDLCREAPTRPVTRPSRSPASGSIDNYPGGIFLH